MACGIYMIKHKNTGQMYIGQSIDIEKRFKQHCESARKLYIDNAIRKHGKENFIFSIICELERDDDLLNAMEEYYVWKFNTYEDDFHYNLTPGGDFNPSKVPEIAEKISKALSGENNPMFGKKGEEHPNFGRKHTPEAKAKISKAMSGENHPFYGKKLSEETKRKISEATMGMHRSPRTEFKKGEMSGSNNPMFNRKHTMESRKKMSEKTKGMYIGKNNPRAKYTLWDNTKCNYSKNDMFRHKTEPRPCKVFSLKYNTKIIHIGGFIDFITCELLHDLIKKEDIYVSN